MLHVLALILRNVCLDHGADKIRSFKGIIHPLKGVYTLFQLFKSDQSCVRFTTEKKHFPFSCPNVEP